MNTIREHVTITYSLVMTFIQHKSLKHLAGSFVCNSWSVALLRLRLSYYSYHDRQHSHIQFAMYQCSSVRWPPMKCLRLFHPRDPWSIHSRVRWPWALVDDDSSRMKWPLFRDGTNGNFRSGSAKVSSTSELENDGEIKKSAPRPTLHTNSKCKYKVSMQ